jgi:hypothetical protein
MIKPRRPRVGRKNSKKNTAKATARQSKRDVPPSTDELILTREPVSAENLLLAATVDHLESLHLTESWFASIPSHLGHSPTLDAATRAFISSNRFVLRCRDASVQICLKHYLRAIELQRQLTLSPTGRLSDEALLSCALLGHFERGMGQRYGPQAITQTFKQTLMHLQAMQKILLNRLNDFRTHQLDYTVVFGHYMLLLEAPIATGTPCPFERLAFPNPHKIINDYSLKPTARLRRLASELMLRAPRLIANVRAAKSGVMTPSELKLFHLRAEALLELRDDNSENILLHSVSIIPSREETGFLTKYSFDFHSVTDFDACFNYWHARLLILRACRLLDLPGKRCEIQDQGRRAITNVLMCWQYGNGPMFMRIRFLHAANTVWGAISDFGVSFAPIEQVQQFGLKQINSLYKGIVGEKTKEALDEVTALYAGGPLTGNLADMYRTFWPG